MKKKSSTTLKVLKSIFGLGLSLILFLAFFNSAAFACPVGEDGCELIWGRHFCDKDPSTHCDFTGVDWQGRGKVPHGECDALNNGQGCLPEPEEYCVYEGGWTTECGSVEEGDDGCCWGGGVVDRCDDPNAPQVGMSLSEDVTLFWERITDWGDEKGVSCRNAPDNPNRCTTRSYYGEIFNQSTGIFVESFPARPNDEGCLSDGPNTPSVITWNVNPANLEPNTEYGFKIWAINDCSCDAKATGSFISPVKARILGRVNEIYTETYFHPDCSSGFNYTCDGIPYCTIARDLDINCSVQRGLSVEVPVEWYCNGNPGTAAYRTPYMLNDGETVRCELSHLPSGYQCNSANPGTDTCVIRKSVTLDNDGNNHWWFYVEKPTAPTPTLTLTPTPALICADLEYIGPRDRPIQPNDTVELWCYADDNSRHPDYFNFQYKYSTGLISGDWRPLEMEVSPEPNWPLQAGTDFTVPDYGHYDFQCQVCEEHPYLDIDTCTEWGKAYVIQPK